MSVASEKLLQFIERLELVRAEKDALRDDEKAIIAEAVAHGFIAKAIRFLLKKRKMAPTERREAEALEDAYLHAAGMPRASDSARFADVMDVDVTSREAVIEAAKKLVPQRGSIEIELAGARVRLTRGDDGEVVVEDVTGRVTPAESGDGKAPPRPRIEPPEVDGAGAEQLGREAFKADQPISANPFPFGDARRPRWDKGWREASGGDGMGGGGGKK